MIPNEKKLEKLVKKVVKQQPVNPADILFHWKGLGERGDRVAINVINRQNGWEAFALWSESEPEMRSLLLGVSDRAGISEAGVLVLKAAGLARSGEDTDRSHALWILQTVRDGPSENLRRAELMMLQSPDFFEGALSLLEIEETQPTAEFLTNLLEEGLPQEQDQAVRKSLYRLRQKGIEAPAKEETVRLVPEQSRQEIFLLAENRLPLWQPFFYYSSQGSRGDWFFAEINEGNRFEIVQQQRNVRMNQKQMQRIAKNYASHFEQGTGVKLAFLHLPSEHARYFVEASFELLSGADDFRKYMGESERQNPFRDWEVKADLLQADAASLLEQEFFILWMVEDEFLKEFDTRLKQIEEGPIVLPEQQRRQQKFEAFDHATEEYFSAEKRRVWSLALEKAAYSFKDSDVESARIALGFARMLSDQGRKISSVPFAAALLERSLQIHEKQEAKRETEEKKTSLIMTPQEYDRETRRR